MASSDEEGSSRRSYKIEKFSGKQEDWQIWSKLFLRQATKKGYKKILLGQENVPTGAAYEAADINTEAGKKIEKLQDLNDLVIEELYNAIDIKGTTGKVAFKIASSCETNEYSNGNAKVAWERLTQKYRPQTAPLRLMLRQKFNAMALKNKKEDPVEWLTELEYLRDQLVSAGATVTDYDVMAQALNNLPCEYEHVILKLEDRLGSSTNPLTLADLQTELNLRYQ